MRGQLFHGASQLLLVAFIASIGFLVLATTKEGMTAAQLFGGLASGTAPEKLVQVAYALDLIFPFFYGAGLAAFAAAWSERGNRPFARILVLLVMIAAAADLIENRYIALEAAGDGIRPVWIAAFTMLKYGLLAIASAGLSTLLVARNSYYQIVVFLLRFAMPVLVALMLANVGGDPLRGLTLLLFAVMLGALAWIAAHECRLLVPEQPSGMISETPSSVESEPIKKETAAPVKPKQKSGSKKIRKKKLSKS